MLPLQPVQKTHPDIVTAPMPDPAGNLAVKTGIEAYGQRQFLQAFNLLYPVLQKLRPELNHAIKPGELRQPAIVVFTILTQLADAFPSAQYSAANSQLYGFTGIGVDIVSGLQRMTDAAQRGHPEARAHLGQLHVSRDKPVAYYWMTLAATPRALAFRDNMALKMSSGDLEFAKRLIDDHHAGRPVDFARQAVCDTDRRWPLAKRTKQSVRVSNAPPRSGTTERRLDAAQGADQTPVSPVDTLMNALADADADGDRARRKQLISGASPKTLRQVLARIRANKPEPKA